MYPAKGSALVCPIPTLTLEGAAKLNAPTEVPCVVPCVPLTKNLIVDPDLVTAT